MKTMANSPAKLSYIAPVFRVTDLERSIHRERRPRCRCGRCLAAEFYVRDPDGYIIGFVQPAE